MNDETKKDKFLRLSSARTSKILEALDILGNLANRSNYDYDEEDVRKMFKQLRSKISESESLFYEALEKENK